MFPTHPKNLILEKNASVSTRGVCFSHPFKTGSPISIFILDLPSLSINGLHHVDSVHGHTATATC